MHLRGGKLLLLVGALALSQANTSLAADLFRVGTSGDYAPFSSELDQAPDAFGGFDIAIAQAYAEDRGLEVKFVRFRWRDLIAGLRAERFDVAMSGVTIRPERSAIGRFTVPVAETGAVVLAQPSERFSKLDDLDRRQIRIGVNAGGHLERVAQARFPHATVISIPNNAAVREALLDETLDAAVTDTLEAQSWMKGTQDVRLIGPFTIDRKAYLVRAGLPDLAADLDAWLLEREADGTLQAFRDQYFGAAESAPAAAPLIALLAAVDERLSLMPLVGVAKRRAGLPLEVPEREAIVLDAAVDAATEAAERADASPPPEAAVLQLFRALLEAAKEVQWKSIRDPEFEAPEHTPDLETELRPGLLRIGERISALLVELPANLDRVPVREAALRELRTGHLSKTRILEIADAISTLTKAATPEPDPR